MRLLLIEDDRELAQGLLQALEAAGYACDLATTGKEAMAAVRSLGTDGYAVAVLDLGLLDIDGLELLTDMRRGGVTTPVLILTARDDLDDRIHGLDAGADDYLVKPFQLGELEARLR